MKSNAQLVPAPPAPVPQVALRQQLRGVLARHTEEILAEVAPTLRRVRTLFLVLAISVPMFFAGLLVVLWHLAR
ncbi:MAG: hypothetical protein ACJ758_01830 [Actinomycetota bacterium]